MIVKKLCIFELFACLYINLEKVYNISFEEKNHPCSIDGTAIMAAPYCGHLDKFFLILKVF